MANRRRAELDPSGRTPVHQLGKIKIGSSNYRLLDMGDWAATNPDSSAREYVPGNVVTSGGIQYLCILAHSNQTPPNGTYWELYEPEKLALHANRIWSKGGDGIQFDTYPQDGGYLYVETNDPIDGDSFTAILTEFPALSSSFGVATAGMLLIDKSGAGLTLYSPGGPLSLLNSGDNINIKGSFDIRIVADGALEFTGGSGGTLIQSTDSSDIDIVPDRYTVIQNLPITDPGVSGALWNSSGALMVSP